MYVTDYKGERLEAYVGLEYEARDGTRTVVKLARGGPITHKGTAEEVAARLSRMRELQQGMAECDWEIEAERKNFDRLAEQMGDREVKRTAGHVSRLIRLLTGG